MADTNIYYGSGIGVAGNIDIGGIGLSADSRLMVKTRAGLDELKAAKRVYDGMIVYCEADQTYHKCRVVWDDAFNIVSCSWTEVVIKSEKELESFIANKTTAAMEFKGATATLPENPAKGDMYKVAGENINIIIDGVSAKIGDSVVYNGTQWFLIPSGDDIESNTTYEFEGQKKSSEVSFKVKPSDNIEETIYLDSYSQKEVDTKLDNYVTSKSIKETLNWVTNVQSGDTSVELANKASYADEASYAESAGSADTAGSAGTATKATQDINGNNIVKTYATKSEVAAKQDKLESGVNIKTINGQSLLNSGDLVLNADGSISTNPDWNQNDETKIDYIKNRTHYCNLHRTGESQTIVFKSVTTEPTSDIEGKICCNLYLSNFPDDWFSIAAGKPIGTKFILEANYKSLTIFSGLVIKYELYDFTGDGSFSTEIYGDELSVGRIDPSTGELAYFHGNDGEMRVIFYIDGTNYPNYDEDVSVTIHLVEEHIKTIDEKYIPDSIARKTEIAELTEGKVDKIVGKGLSTNDYTNEDKQKLIDWKVPIIDFWDYLECKDLRPTLTTYEQVYSDELFDNMFLSIGFGKKEEMHNGLYPILSITSDDGNIVRYCPITDSYYTSEDRSVYLYTIIKLSEKSYIKISTPGYFHEEGPFQSLDVASIVKESYIVNKSIEANNAVNAINDSNGNKIIDTYALKTRYEGTGKNSFVANGSCEASSEYCFACGSYSQATALGAYAEGRDTLAKSFYSHAEGLGTITNNTCQHVQGHFNKIDGSALHIVGNGKNEEERSNAHVLYNNGDAWYAGKVTASEIQIGNTVFTEEQLMKILNFIETINVGGNN